MRALAATTFAVFAVLAAGCASTDYAIPPSRAELEASARANGAAAAYEEHKVTLDGSVVFGHDVVVGKAKKRSPAQAYFSQSFVEVPNPWGWLGTVGLGIELCGLLVITIPTAISSVAFIGVGPLIGALVVGVGCIGLGFGVMALANLGDEGGAETYNKAIKNIIDSAAGSAAPAVPPQPQPASVPGPAARTGERGDAAAIASLAY